MATFKEKLFIHMNQEKILNCFQFKEDIQLVTLHLCQHNYLTWNVTEAIMHNPFQYKLKIFEIFSTKKINCFIECFSAMKTIPFTSLAHEATSTEIFH